MATTPYLVRAPDVFSGGLRKMATVGDSLRRVACRLDELADRLEGRNDG